MLSAARELEHTVFEVTVTFPEGKALCYLRDVVSDRSVASVSQELKVAAKSPGLLFFPVSCLVPRSGAFYWTTNIYVLQTGPTLSLRVERIRDVPVATRTTLCGCRLLNLSPTCFLERATL